MNKLIFLWITSILVCSAQAADLNFYFGDQIRFNNQIPSPESVLGFQVGDWHVRHDQLVSYMQAIASASDRVKLKTIGYSHERRPLLHLTFSSPENLSRLEEIRKVHLDLARGEGSSKQQPVVIWLAYSVHGNEASGSNAALLMAYYLAASLSVDDLLQNAVIILDPSLNPDGLARFASWVNSHKGHTLDASRYSREHNEAWPRGRTNHYWFDLNRDWLLLVHPESQARIAEFHRWRPNILTDHHEMGENSTFFFQPGIPSRQNPLTPEINLKLTRHIAGFHARAFDAQQKLYFTEQAFDDFYYGKGSTYPDIQGCIGILFEQASCRGHLSQNTYGSHSFADAIKNQVSASLSTLKAGLESRELLLNYLRDIAQEDKRESVKDKTIYVFGSDEDPTRAAEMLHTLMQHQIEVFRLAKPIQLDHTILNNGFVVPLKQAQFRLVKSLFEKVTRFNDNSFYDVSSWHFPSAFGLAYKKLASDKEGFRGSRISGRLELSQQFSMGAKAYAYAFSWKPHFAPRAAYRLLDAGVKLRFATSSFTARTATGEVSFKPGTMLLPLGVQDLSQQAIDTLLEQCANLDQLTIHTLTGGLTPAGHDLGSNSFKELKMPRIALLSGAGMSPTAVGEIWHLLDKRMEIPVTLLDKARLKNADLSAFSHLAFARGKYGDVSEKTLKKLSHWLEAGGTLVAMQSAVKWSIEKDLVKAELREAPKDDDTKQRLIYRERNKNKALKRIAGAAFWGEVDTTHPLGFGLDQQQIALFRNSSLMLEPAKNPYGTVVQYSQEPLISGYVSAENLKRLQGSAAMIANPVRKGVVVLMTDSPNFRGYWLGTNKLLLNALFFSSALAD